MSELLVEDLRGELARGRVIVLVGAGVSAGATGGAPVASWPGLLENGVARCEELALRPLPAGWGDRTRARARLWPGPRRSGAVPAPAGPDDPSLGAAHTNLGAVPRDLGDPQSARIQFERALAILQAAYGRDHPRVTVVRDNIAALRDHPDDMKG